jgi:hypothetical protein
VTLDNPARGSKLLWCNVGHSTAISPTVASSQPGLVKNFDERRPTTMSLPQLNRVCGECVLTIGGFRRSERPFQDRHRSDVGRPSRRLEFDVWSAFNFVPRVLVQDELGGW